MNRSDLGPDVRAMAPEVTVAYNTSPGDASGSGSDYDYEYDDPTGDIPLRLLPVTIFYCVTLVLGVVGNILVILSIARYRRMRTVTNIFLTSLASADLLLVLLCVPIKLAKWLTFSWTFGEVLCKLVHYLQNVSVICSILTLTAISLERYYAVLHPMRAKYTCTVRRARRVILALWTISVLLAAPRLIGQVHKEVGLARKAYWCVKDWPLPWLAQLYETAMLTLIFIIPLIFMCFAYVNICREMALCTRSFDRRWIWGRSSCDEMVARRVSVARETDSCVSSGVSAARSHHKLRIRPTRDDSQTRKQVIRMLVTIIILFAVCWGPLLIDNVLVAYGVVNQLHYGVLKPMRQAFALLAYCNSCINPIVYAFMSRHFRTTFLATLHTFFRRKRRSTADFILNPVGHNTTELAALPPPPLPAPKRTSRSPALHWETSAGSDVAESWPIAQYVPKSTHS